MKRIVEIKRGEPVPSNAKWLKDIEKEDGVKRAPSGDGGICYVTTYAVYDVFEVEEIKSNGVKPTEAPGPIITEGNEYRLNGKGGGAW